MFDPPKNMISLCILKILKEETDEDRRLSQSQILEKLKEYGLEVNRKTVYRNLQSLMEYYPEIAHGDLVERKNGVKVINDYYYIHPLTRTQMQVIVYSILFSNHIAANQKNELLSSLSKLTSKQEWQDIKSVSRTSDEKNGYTLFMNLEILNDAIAGKKKIGFFETEYGINKRLHKTNYREVSPYRMFGKNGEFYLVALETKAETEKRYFFRIDRMADIEILEEKAVIPKDKRMLDAELSDLTKFVSTSTSIEENGSFTPVQLGIKDVKVFSEFIDKFGTNGVHVRKDKTRYSEDEKFIVSAKVHTESIMQFIWLHPEIEVLSMTGENALNTLMEAVKKGILRHDLIERNNADES